MRIGSLFSGAGGLDMAVQAVFGGEVAWHCEVDAAASKVLAHHYPTTTNLGDITTVPWYLVRDCEPVDVLCGGWPCQPFSLAGKRKGIDDERALWPHVARAIRALRPRYVVLENVSAVLRSPEFSRVADSLAKAGYEFAWTCLRASAVGAPHRRERLFVVATDSTGDGRHERRPEPARLVGGSDASLSGDEPVELLPTPVAHDGKGSGPSGYARNTPDLQCIDFYLPTPAAADGNRGQDFARANREGSGGDDLVTLAVKATRDSQWGKYEPAIRRWEQVTRPAPAPTEPNRNGNPRLAPAFSEWMLGWPEGWVTQVPGISRNDQLRIVGNGVCPQQAVAALRYLLSVAEVAA